MQENNKVSDDKEAHENIESGFDKNDLYQIDNMSLDDKKEKLNELSMSLNVNLNIHLRLKLRKV